MTRNLEEAARIMVYEYDMFIASCFLLSHYAGSSQVVRNLALEGALLHARNLADFLRPRGPHNDDIRATHFLNNRQALSRDPLAGQRTRLNKRLAHPSHRRSTLLKPWRMQQLYDALMRAWAAFMKRLAIERPDRVEWFCSASSLPMSLPAEQWDSYWIEAESAMLWWQPEDLHGELSQLLAALNANDIDDE